MTKSFEQKFSRYCQTSGDKEHVNDDDWDGGGDDDVIVYFLLMQNNGLEKVHIFLQSAVSQSDSTSLHLLKMPSLSAIQVPLIVLKVEVVQCWIRHLPTEPQQSVRQQF